MKVVAVIPARAGSKGIPNKNIRLLAGRPMVSYVIENALNSKLINDIVVTTDSTAVKTIAKQMGVRVVDRDVRLCRDDVTLDAVIFDAIKDCDCDIVVTMQPTSPTLTVKTLDSALRQFMDTGIDTLISAHNAPHLAWTKDASGKLIHLYEKRLNRQYLPPHFEETGAFVISRRAVVSEDTRIGEKVEVFPLPDSESTDVDDFSDLMTVSMILESRKVAFYVNGNNRRGLGHVYRALELADEFYLKPDIYYDINQTERAIFGETTHNLIGVNGIGELLPILRQNQYSVLINDILSTSIDYMIAVRTALPKAKIINFEDDGEGAEKADAVFNALFADCSAENVYAGEKYYVSSKLFNYYRPIAIREKVKTVFISFGGADPQNYSDRLLRIVSKSEYSSYDFRVVLGRAKTNADALLDYNRYPNIVVYKDIENMPEIMSECDIGITSRGRTGYELALLGIPSIAMAQNKREEKHGFVCEENGFSYLGLNPTDAIIEGTLRGYLEMPASDRKRFQELLLSHDLTNGRSRVMNIINAR